MVDVRVDQILDRAIDRPRVLIHARLQLREVGIHSDSSLLVRFSDGRCPRGARPLLPGASLPGSRQCYKLGHDRCHSDNGSVMCDALATTDAGFAESRMASRLRLDPLDARALDRGAGAAERPRRVRLALVPPGERHPVARAGGSRSATSRARRRGAAAACARAGRSRRPRRGPRLRHRGEDDRPSGLRPRPDDEPRPRLDGAGRRGDAAAVAVRIRSVPSRVGGESRSPSPPRRPPSPRGRRRGAAASGSRSAAGRSARDRGAAARTRRSTPAAPRPSRRSGGTTTARIRAHAEVSSPTASTTSSERPQLGQKRAPIRSGAPQAQIAPLPPAQARPADERVDLRDARLDRDELGAALDDERLR